jgi:hypothetical protein
MPERPPSRALRARLLVESLGFLPAKPAYQERVPLTRTRSWRDHRTTEPHLVIRRPGRGVKSMSNARLPSAAPSAVHYIAVMLPLAHVSHSWQRV